MSSQTQPTERMSTIDQTIRTSHNICANTALTLIGINQLLYSIFHLIQCCQVGNQINLPKLIANFILKKGFFVVGTHCSNLLLLSFENPKHQMQVFTFVRNRFGEILVLFQQIFEFLLYLDKQIVLVLAVQLKRMIDLLEPEVNIKVVALFDLIKNLITDATFAIEKLELARLQTYEPRSEQISDFPLWKNKLVTVRSMTYYFHHYFVLASEVYEIECHQWIIFFIAKQLILKFLLKSKKHMLIDNRHDHIVRSTNMEFLCTQNFDFSIVFVFEFYKCTKIKCCNLRIHLHSNVFLIVFWFKTASFISCTVGFVVTSNID